MHPKLKKTLLAALPLAGLLLINSPASAHHEEHERFHDELGGLHQQEHGDLNALHQEFHEHPYSRWEHRRFHRELNWEHRRFHNDLGDLHRDYHDRDWYGGRRYDDDDHDRGGWYGGQRYYGNGGYSGPGGMPWWGPWFAR